MFRVAFVVYNAALWLESRLTCPDEKWVICRLGVIARRVGAGEGRPQVGSQPSPASPATPRGQKCHWPLATGRAAAMPPSAVATPPTHFPTLPSPTLAPFPSPLCPTPPTSPSLTAPLSNRLGEQHCRRPVHTDTRTQTHKQYTSVAYTNAPGHAPSLPRAGLWKGLLVVQYVPDSWL